METIDRVEQTLGLLAERFDRVAHKVEQEDAFAAQMEVLAREFADLARVVTESDKSAHHDLLDAVAVAAKLLSQQDARTAGLRDLGESLIRIADSLPVRAPIMPVLPPERGASSEPAKFALEGAAFLIFEQLLGISAKESAGVEGQIALFSFASRGACGCCGERTMELIRLPAAVLEMPVLSLGASLSNIAKSVAGALRQIAAFLKGVMKKLVDDAKKLLSNPEDYLYFLCPSACGKAGLMGPLKTSIQVDKNPFGVYSATLQVTWLFCCRKPCLVVYWEYFTKSLDDEIYLPGGFPTAAKATAAANAGKAAALAAATPKNPC